MLFDSFSGPGDRLQPAVARLPVPFFQVDPGGIEIGLLEEILEGELDGVGAGCLAVQLFQRLQPLFLLCGQVAGVLEPQIAGSLQPGVFLGLAAADFVYGVVDDS